MSYDDIRPSTTSIVVFRTAHTIMRDITFATDERTKEIYYYEEGVYIRGAETKIEQRVQTILGDRSSTHIVNEVINTIRRRTYIENFDNDINLICLKNCVLNIITLETQEHSPELFLTNKLDIIYNPEIDCPRIKQFLREILNERNIPVIEEFGGYGLYRGYPIHKSFMFEGIGANGKTTLLNLITIFLGAHNVSSVELERFGSDKFASSDLYQKLANFCADIPSKILVDTGIFKMLTGQDSIRAQRKYGHAFVFNNHAKLAFSTNQIPLTKDTSDAFFRRWRIISFPNKFEGENANPNLINELTTPQELSGFLNLALKGLKRLLENNEFSNEPTTEEIRDYYLLKSDSVYAFIKSCTVEDRTAAVRKELFYIAYCDFCRVNKLYSVILSTFWKAVRRYVPYNEERRSVQRRRVKFILGLRLLDPQERSAQRQTNSSLILGTPTRRDGSTVALGTHDSVRSIPEIFGITSDTSGSSTEINANDSDTLDITEQFLDFIRDATQIGSIPVSKDLVVRKCIQLENGNEQLGMILFQMNIIEGFIEVSANDLFVNYIRDYRDCEEIMCGVQIEGEEDDLFDDLEEEEDVIE